jgi:DNA polymerase elongation subunit (family B)
VQESKTSTLIFSLQILLEKYLYGVKRMWMFGVDQNGYSVCVGVEDYHPSFLAVVPGHWENGVEEMQDECEALVDTANEELFEEHNSNHFGGGGAEGGSEAKIQYVDRIRVVEQTPFIGFTNGRKDRLLEVSCSSMNCYKKTVDYFKGLGKTYHSDFEHPNQFLQQTGFTYQSWLTLENVSYRTGGTHCNIEGRVCMSDMSVYRGETTVSIPPTLKCFVRCKAVSRDGVVQEEHHQYYPNACNHRDRVMCVALVFVWSFQADSAPMAEVLLTTFPDASVDEKKNPLTSLIRCDSEINLMTLMKDTINTYDPDDLFHFPDFIHPFVYMSQRSEVCGHPDFMYFERFKKTKCRAFGDNNVFTGFRCNSRSLVDIQSALKKKVFIPVESYDLKTVSCHPMLRKNPEKRTSFTSTKHDMNLFIRRGVLGRSRILKTLLKEVRLITQLERDCGMRLEFANISSVSDTGLSATVSRGEQVRVFNKLTHFCRDENFYVNSGKIAQKPLKFPIRKRPPTFQDPPEHPITTKLRRECKKQLRKKQAYHPSATGSKSRKKLYQDTENVFGDGGSHSVASKSEGGNVMFPCPKFWADLRIAVLDFASLYPSIMEAFNISYENLVYDQEYMDLPGVVYIIYAVNKYETVAIADVAGIIPKLLKLLVDSRSLIKKKMKAEKDPFRRSVYDKEQNSMKVLCNATYGFTGAEKGSLLAIKPIMYVVTGIGRYLQKQTSEYLAHTYGIPSVYGDTDSVFVVVSHDEKQSIEQIAVDVGNRYCLEGYEGIKPFTWENVCAHYMTRKWGQPLQMADQCKKLQVNAVLYLAYLKLSAEVTGIFRTEIRLEFENMSDNVWMGWVKKHYCYRFWDTSVPTIITKIKITGMPSKKREYSPWTRFVLNTMTEMILNDRCSEIKEFLTIEMDKLITGQLTVDDLKVSRAYNGALKYKHFRQPHLQVVLKLEKRQRIAQKEKSRVYFVIVTGTKKMYLRSETPEYAKLHSIPLDLEYYMKQQFFKPVSKLLTFHPEIMNFTKVFKVYLSRLQLSNGNMTNVSNMGGGAGNTRMTIADAVRAIKRTRRHVKQQPKPVQSLFLKKKDPFARFLN